MSLAKRYAEAYLGDYVEVWETVLSIFVHWSEQRIVRWMDANFGDALYDCRTIVRCEAPLYWVVDLLIPDRIRRDPQCTKPLGPGGLLTAIEGDGDQYDYHGNRDFDWFAAADRFNAALEVCGSSLEELRREHALGLVPYKYDDIPEW